MKRYLAIIGLALTAMVTMAVPVAAAVAFDPATGVGFVGKGDVQSAFGWNNAQLQKNAAGVTFSYESVDVYEITAEWWTGPARNRTYHTITVPRNVTVSTAVAYDARTHKQIDGFILTGAAYSTGSGRVPVVGENFNDGNDVKTIIAVTLISSSGGGLTVNYGGTSVPLWPETY